MIKHWIKYNVFIVFSGRKDESLISFGLVN